MSGVTYQQLSVSDWDSIQVEKPKSKPSIWDEVIETVISGEIVAIPVAEKDVRGKRIGIARRASNGFGKKLQFRYDATKQVLAIRLAGDVPENDTSKKPVGRPKKTQ